MIDSKNIYCPVEWYIIKGFYGDRKAERSGVPLMCHIEEGVSILKALGADEITVRAYMLHPVVQSNADVVGVSGLGEVYNLAVMYREYANSFLPTKNKKHLMTAEGIRDTVGVLPDKVALMLYADKIQNQKDFYTYHSKTHPNRELLNTYFNLWIDFLLGHPVLSHLRSW